MADILENPVDLIDDAYEQEIQVEQEMIEVVAYRSYNRLDDKPQINGVELVGNKTSSDLGITAQIESAVNSEAQARAQADNTLQGKIDTEKLARQQADSTLQGNIDAEETARKAADKDIQDVLDGETLARQNADTALGGRIDTEIHDRQVADIALQGQIDAITSKSDVVDVVANYVALQAYDTSSLGNNDVIKVLDDETHEDALTYYRWSTTTQTWTYIGQESPYYSKSQTDTLLLGKQNTIDSSHKLSADLVDDTSTTNKFVTASDITNWNGKQDALTAGTGIDITGDVISTPAIVPEVVAELPTTGAEGKLYLTPKAHTTSTATGNPIEATVTEQAGQLESFQLDGDTFQQTYTGKNLTPYPYAGGGNPRGITFTANNDGTVTLNGKNDDTGISNYYLFNGSMTLSAGTYYMVVPPEENILFVVRIGNNYYGFNAENNYRQVFNSSVTISEFYIQVRKGVTTQYNNVKVYPMLSTLSGQTSADYEPFVGGIPSPNPDYPQQIQTVTGEQTVTIAGKNLFDKTKDTAGGYLDSSGASVSANNWSTSGYIKVAPGENYTISGVSTPGISPKSCYYDSSKQFVSSFSCGNQTITIPSGVAYLRLSIFNGVGGDGVARYDSNTLQLEPGSTATTYAPYHATSYPIDLGSIELCKLGTYQDYIWKDGESWKVHRETKRVTVDGSQRTGNLTQYGYAQIRIDSEALYVSAPPVSYCSNLPSRDIYDSLPKAYSVRSSATQCNFRLYFTPQLEDFDAYLDWCAENKPSVVAPLQQSAHTDTVITDHNLIAQLEAVRTASLQNGTNTISNSATGSNLAGDMEIGYYGFNPRNRYDKWLWLDLNNNYEQIGGE